MSAFVCLDTTATGARLIRTACAGLLAALAFTTAGTAFAQAANSIDALTVSKGTSGRTIVRFVLKQARPIRRRFAIERRRESRWISRRPTGSAARSAPSTTRRCAA
jgi:hypothetical protein